MDVCLSTSVSWLSLLFLDPSSVVFSDLPRTVSSLPGPKWEGPREDRKCQMVT